ncbi:MULTISPECIES: winged helix-turn-helix domain-containing protein [Yersinia]|uniref:winged helix-turn-helix domain-containing protein n=1 Tax=Yersinia TaxID=629 RepID=UPI0005E001AD|nr:MULTISPECIES: winged helix-turn-helix domain-containing protein [Yersinia]QDW32394.1 transcriptional regulator [Yersinia sp. KBS0713]CFQ33768.1 putative regulatory membrane protein [Yersinia bercovieri]
MDEIIIGNIIFTPTKRAINKGGAIVKIRNKESEVLSLLCHHYPSSLSREDIEREIWGESYVTDNTLTQTISNLRNALDDKDHEIVTTIPKKGYSIGIKPSFISSGSPQDLRFTHADSTVGVKPKSISLSLRFLSFRYKAIMLVVSVVLFFISFELTSNYYQIKINEVKSLPILVGLDKVRDKEFLSLYQKDPYVFLKRRSHGEYIACKYCEGELICEKK